MECKVRLSDHNFVVGIRHTLIPSVYVVYEIKENGELSYSGNTFIRIRSGKHYSSSAHTHAYDIKELFESSNLPEGPILVLFIDGALKSVDISLFSKVTYTSRKWSLSRE